jgi:lipopolysaccharide export system protein LptC
MDPQAAKTADPPPSHRSAPAQDGTANTAGPSGPKPEQKRGSYSRFVTLMRICLPAGALALAGLVVLWPQLQVGDKEFRPGVASGNPQDADNLRMVNARFAGINKKTLPYTVTAPLAIQDGPGADEIELSSPKTDITLKDGSWLAVTADRGRYFQSRQTLDLFGMVNLFHDSGYEFQSTRAHIDLIAGTAEGDEPVAGQGPFGELTAEGFRISDKGKTIHFTGTAKLVIYPSDKRSASDGS